MKKKFTYFFAYVTDTGLHGNADVILDRPIGNAEDLRKVEAMLLISVQKQHPMAKRLSVSNWQKFD